MAATLMPLRRAADSPAPFVTPQANAILHADMTMIDIDAIDAMSKRIMAKNPPKDPVKAAKEQADTEKQLAKARKWLNDFETAGGKTCTSFWISARCLKSGRRRCLYRWTMRPILTRSPK